MSRPRKVLLGKVPYPTLDEMVLLYLLERLEVDRESPQAEQLTAQVIARSLRTGRPQVARALGRWRKEEVLGLQLSHIRGAKRSQWIPLLTQKGINRARDIRERLREAEFRVERADGTVELQPLREIPRLFGRRVSVVGILAMAPQGHLHLDELAPTQVPLRGLIVVGDRIVPPRHFFGRERELEAIELFLNGKGATVLVLHGFAGIGKTTLVSKFASSHSGTWRFAILRLGPTWTPEALAEGVLQALGVGPVTPIQTPADRTAAMARFAESWDACNVVLVLDQVEQAPTPCREVLGGLVAAVAGRSRPGLILTSRGRPTFYRRSEVMRAGHVLELPVDRLPPETAAEFARWGGRPPNDAAAIAAASRGSPLLLSLMVFGPYAPSSAALEVHRYVEEELLGQMPSRLRKIVEHLAVHVRSVPGRAIPEARRSDWDLLTNQGLVREDGPDAYTLHEEVREVVLAAMTAGRLRDTHLRAAKYYASLDPPDVLEESRHLALARREPEAAGRLLPVAGQIINGGQSSPLLPILGMLLPSILSRETRSELLVAVGRCRLVRGEQVKAEMAFREAREIIGSDNDRLLAEALLGLGSVAMKKSNLTLAESLLTQASALFERSGSVGGLSRATYELGNLEWKRHEPRVARLHFEKLRDIARTTQDPVGEGLALLGLGRIAQREQGYEASFPFYERASRMLSEAGAVREALKAEISFGGLLHELKREENAREVLLRALTLARQFGELELEAHALYSLAYSRLGQGNGREAMELMRECYRIAERLGDVSWMEDILSRLGHIALVIDDASAAREEFRKSADLARAVGDGLYAEHLARVGFFQHKTGHRAAALRYALQAEKLAKRVRNSHAAGEAKKLLSLLQGKVGSARPASRV